MSAKGLSAIRRFLTAARKNCFARPYALKLARAEAERIGGPLVKRPFLVTDNGPSFIARRFTAFIKDQFSHVRIQYRTPQQLGLLERFHATLKTEEVYWRLYDHPQHARACLAEFRARYNERRAHWALVPEEGGMCHQNSGVDHSFDPPSA
jgi:transposase InsO family protein